MTETQAQSMTNEEHDQATQRGDLHEELQAMVDNHGWIGVLFMARTIAEDEGRDELAESLDTASETVEPT